MSVEESINSTDNPDTNLQNGENNSLNHEMDETKNFSGQLDQNRSLQNAPKDGATRTPRPIVIVRPDNMSEIIKKISDECDNNFFIKTTENWMKRFADSLEIKQKIIEHFKIS